MPRKPSKSQLALENASRLASIGIAAMEAEESRRRAYVALREIRAARRQAAEEWDGEDLATYPNVPQKESGYAAAAKERKNSRARMVRMIARYRQWLAEVNA